MQLTTLPADGFKQPACLPVSRLPGLRNRSEKLLAAANGSIVFNAPLHNDKTIC